MDKWLADQEEGMTLVHGRPTLQCEPFGEYGHAWIEYRQPLENMSKMFNKNIELEVVFDVVTGMTMPKELYYKAGKIDPDKCFRYDVDAMRRWVLDTGHWGPWEGPEACGPVPGHKGE